MKFKLTDTMEDMLTEQTEKEPMDKTTTIIVGIAIFASLLILTASAIFVVNKISLRDATKKEKQANILTNTYIGNLTGNIEVEGEYVDSEKESTLNYSGRIGCCLIIPKIDLQRVVLEGGDETANLEQFLFTSASDDMHYNPNSNNNYCIWGHQSYVWGFSMNRLDELTFGDKFYLLTDDGYKYEYEVYDIITSQWDFSQSDLLGEDDTVSIYTCVKQKTEPKPFYVVRGKRTGNKISVLEEGGRKDASKNHN